VSVITGGLQQPVFKLGMGFENASIKNVRHDQVERRQGWSKQYGPMAQQGISLRAHEHNAVKAATSSHPVESLSERVCPCEE